MSNPATSALGASFSPSPVFPLSIADPMLSAPPQVAGAVYDQEFSHRGNDPRPSTLVPLRAGLQTNLKSASGTLSVYS